MVDDSGRTAESNSVRISRAGTAATPVQPIPVAQMRQWRAATVARIRELRPRRVLEIGVGTGLLLSQLAPDCEEYWATDFSAPTIEALRAGVAGAVVGPAGAVAGAAGRRDRRVAGRAISTR